MEALAVVICFPNFNKGIQKVNMFKEKDDGVWLVPFCRIPLGHQIVRVAVRGLVTNL